MHILMHCLISLHVKSCYVVGSQQELHKQFLQGKNAGFAFIVENRQRSFLHLSCFDIFRRPDSVYLVSEREEGNRHESLS